MGMATSGERLRRLRKDRGISLEETAHLLHLSFSALAMYERDERTPSADRLQQLADFYGVSTDYLLVRDNAIMAGETASHYDPDALASRWPDLSPDRRRTAAEWETATKAAGMPTMFGHDLTDDEFDAILDVLKQAIAAFAGLAEKIKAAFPHK